ncbi:hypothetical protein [Flavobacterium sp.]|uniref:hypothetical protein n=1 Tax=Flavobacterium sp. TaxID=239 RepID=UPI002605725A|nr:hypothetical protein [Flavobacterium sp.]
MKNINSYLLLLLVLFICLSCETENLVLDKQRQADIHSRKVNLNELSNHGNALEKLMPFLDRKSSNMQQRLMYYPDFGFYVDVDDIMMKQMGENISFTLPVYRTTPEERTENLVLSLAKNDNYIVSLLRYSLSQGDKEDILNNLGITNLEDKTELIQLIDKDFPMAARSATGGYEGIIFKSNVDGSCFRIDHCWMEADGWHVTFLPVDCPPEEHTDLSLGENGEGGGGNPGPIWYPIPVHGSAGNIGPTDGGPLSGGSNTGGNNPVIPPILTEPLVKLNKLQMLNCEELKKLAQDTLFNHRMHQLTYNIGGTNEQGFNVYDYTNAPTPGLDPTCGPLLTSPNAQHIDYGAIDYFRKAIAHNHLEGESYKHTGVFNPEDLNSFGDVLWGASIQQSALDYAELAAFLVCVEGTYAIKLADKQKFLNFLNHFNTDVKFRDQIKKFYDDNKMKHGQPSIDQNRGFLNMLIQFDVGIDLYEEDSAAQYLQNWNRLSLDSQGNIIKTPC